MGDPRSDEHELTHSPFTCLLYDTGHRFLLFRVSLDPSFINSVNRGNNPTKQQVGSHGINKASSEEMKQSQE